MDHYRWEIVPDNDCTNILYVKLHDPAYVARFHGHLRSGWEEYMAFRRVRKFVINNVYCKFYFNLVQIS